MYVTSALIAYREIASSKGIDIFAQICACFELKIVPNCTFRWVIGSWMLFAFIYTAGYSGNLRAFLMNPEVERPIDSVAAVVESGMGKYKLVMGSGRPEPEKTKFNAASKVPYNNAPKCLV